MIDVGKTFREQVLQWFVRYGIPRVDSIILTHEHADAVLGLDDIRTVQPFSPTNDIEPTPIYLTLYAMDSLAMKFPSLVLRKLAPGEEVNLTGKSSTVILTNHSWHQAYSLFLCLSCMGRIMYALDFFLVRDRALLTYLMFPVFSLAQNMAQMLQAQVTQRINRACSFVITSHFRTYLDVDHSISAFSFHDATMNADLPIWLYCLIVFLCLF